MQLLNRRDDSLDAFPLADENLAADDAFIFSMEGLSFRTFVSAGPAPRRGCYTIDLREAFLRLPLHFHRAAVKASELLQLSEANRYCGFCGARTRRSGPLARVCTSCGREFFPQISPCVIVLVKRGDEALLVHARNFARPVYGLIAGYVETGETLEECVAREIREETSLEVENIRYIGSQPWPNPGNLMLAFTADYVAGELCFADEELSAGGFFRRDSLPQLPSGSSIARRLVNRWIAGEI